MAKETLQTISERTGFSVSTVSRVLSGQAAKYRISDNAVEIITKEAKKSNYTPSLLAKHLRTGKTQTIGLLIPAIDNPYFANIASVIIAEAKNHGYTIILVDTMENEANEREGLDSLLSREVDGIMLAPSGSERAYMERINDTQTPIVLIDRFYDSTTLPYITTNNYQGAFDAVQYLADGGHRDILCIQGVPHSMPVRDRVRGYLDALKKNGLEKHARIVGNNFSIQNGYLEVRLALNLPSRPTAIFAMSNTILLGAVRAIRESGLEIPRDISIISFDDNTYLDFMNPAITRVSQPINEIGSLAVKILMDSFENGKRSDAQIQLSPRLIVRNSVAVK
jgi:LacI family transcriptional regulator